MYLMDNIILIFHYHEKIYIYILYYKYIKLSFYTYI